MAGHTRYTAILHACVLFLPNLVAGSIYFAFGDSDCLSSLLPPRTRIPPLLHLAAQERRFFRFPLLTKTHQLVLLGQTR